MTDALESSVCAISSSSPGGPGLSHLLVAVLGRVIPSSPLTPSRPSSAIQTSPSRGPPAGCKPGVKSKPPPPPGVEVVGNPAIDRATTPTGFSSRQSSGDRLDDGNGGLCRAAGRGDSGEPRSGGESPPPLASTPSKVCRYPPPPPEGCGQGLIIKSDGVAALAAPCAAADRPASCLLSAPSPRPPLMPLPIRSPSFSPAASQVEEPVTRLCHLCSTPFPASRPPWWWRLLPTAAPCSPATPPSSFPGARSGQTSGCWPPPSLRLLLPPSSPPRPTPPPRLLDVMTSVSDIEVPMLRWRPELDTEATASSVAALAEATAATAAATAAARVERRSGPPLAPPPPPAVTIEDEPASEASAAPEFIAGVADAALGVAATGDDVFSSAAVERGRWRPSTWNTGESAEPSTCSLSSARFESRARSSLARSLLPLAPEDLDPGCARLGTR